MISCRRNAAWLLAALLGIAPLVARAEGGADQRATSHLHLGQKLFSEGKYEAAIEELRAGYVLSPQPRFLYALGQAYRHAHRCSDAVRAYRDFLASEPSDAQRTATQENIARCASEDPASVIEPVAPTPAPAPAPAPPPAMDSAHLAPPPTAAVERKPVYKRWWPWTTLGIVVAGAGLGLGLGLGLHASSSHFNATLPDVGPKAMALSAGAAP